MICVPVSPMSWWHLTDSTLSISAWISRVKCCLQWLKPWLWWSTHHLSWSNPTLFMIFYGDICKIVIFSRRNHIESQKITTWGWFTRHFLDKNLVWVLVVLVPSQDGWHLLAPAWSSPPASHGLVGGWPTRPEKWWSSSVGMMTFPTEWKNNPNVPNHQAVYRMIQKDKATLSTTLWNMLRMKGVEHFDIGLTTQGRF